MLAAVIQLTALAEGALGAGSGAGVHGLWFRRWAEVDPDTADALHRANQVAPFTLSPLMGLPHPRDGQVAVAAGDTAWFRVTVMEEALAGRLREVWLPTLPAELALDGTRWSVAGWTTDPAVHPWAGQVEARALAERRLLDREAPARLHLCFATPTAFHGAAGHLPFPLPDALIGSWLRRWQAFGPVRLPDRLPALARDRLVISAYRLQTVPVRRAGRTTIGCVGQMTLHGAGLKPGERAALSLLAAFSFYCGSGHHTTQGLGMTRLVEPR